MSTSDFAAWSTEIQVELAGATEALSAAKTAQVEAQIACDQAQAERSRIDVLLDGLATPGDAAHVVFGLPRAGLSPHLLRRRDPAALAARQAECALSLARQLAVNAEWRVADATEALAVLTKAMSPVETDGVSE